MSTAWDLLIQTVPELPNKDARITTYLHCRRHEHALVFLTRTLCLLALLGAATPAHAAGGIQGFVIRCAEGLKALGVHLLTDSYADRTTKFTLADGSGTIRLKFGPRLGFGLRAAVYDLQGAEGVDLKVRGLDVPMVAKLGHRITSLNILMPSADFYLKGEADGHHALKEQLAKLPPGAARPEWPNGIPAVDIIKVVDTKEAGPIIFKQRIDGEGLKKLQKKYQPRKPDDLPAAMLGSLRHVFDFVNAVDKSDVRMPSGDRRLLIDSNPTNLVWVDKPEVMAQLGMDKPGFIFYEIGEMPPGTWYDRLTKDYDQFLHIFLDFMRADEKLHN